MFDLRSAEEVQRRHGANLGITAQATEKITSLLDWFINPNHAPLLVADWIGAFQERRLAVELVPSQDPSQPPHQLAEGKGDLAINYQPELYFLRRDGLSVVRVGGLIPSPLVAYLTENPEDCWQRFVTAYPDLDNALNGAARETILPLFACKPTASSAERYEQYGHFLVSSGLLDKSISAGALLTRLD